MRSLPEPQIGAEQSYRTTISRVRNGDLKTRLHAIIPEIVDASDRFARAAADGEVALLSRAAAVGSVTADEMEAIYSDRFAKLKSPGRVHYDRIITSAPNGRCPLCAQRSVATLDHFLPQTGYPALVVTPFNLVPACSDCNKAKLATVPASAETVTLHPYFDDVNGDEWLVAQMRETSPASVVFEVQTPVQWPSVLAARVKHHFDFFRLAELYAAQAAEEILNIRFHLKTLFDVSGAAGVATHLAEMARSRAQAHINSWQTATYKAFAASSWFCDGGFAEPE
jgi:hypothetical protein